MQARGISKAAFFAYGSIGCLALVLLPIVIAVAFFIEDQPEPQPTNTSQIIRSSDVKKGWPFRVSQIKVRCEIDTIWGEAEGVAVGLVGRTAMYPERYTGQARVGYTFDLDRKDLAEAPPHHEVAHIARDRCTARANAGLLN